LLARNDLKYIPCVWGGGFMLSNVIEKCRFVVENAKYVKIDYSKIDLLADEIKNYKITQYLDSSPFGILELETEDIINFLLIEDALQFSFWSNPKWTIETENGELDGGAALLYCMLKMFKEHKNNFFEYVEHMTKDEFKTILKGNIEIPLFDKRYDIITSMARIVNAKMNGNFYKYIKGITADNDLFQILISNFTNLQDTRLYNNQIIPFYKLGQYMTSNMLHIMKIKNNSEVDTSHLVGCADYKIPQVLRNLSILKYNDTLSKTVDSKIEIQENEPQEVEIRASMIVVIDEIWKRVNGTVDRIDINNFIWLKGQTKSKDAKPYHLTRTSTY
jgi:hypothetical protein